MPEPPRFPGRLLLGWLATTGHIIVVGMLIGAFKSTESKVGVVLFDVSGIVVIVSVYLARLFEWNRLKPHLREAAREEAGKASAGPGRAQGRRRHSGYRQVA